MKNQIKRYCWCLLCTLLVMVAGTLAQTDPHFTQNYTFPMYINPALAGSADGEIRVSGIFRNQWSSVGSPYRTVGASADARVDDNIALGISVLNQRAGDAGFNYLTASGSLAYTGVKFGPNLNHRIVMAIQGGLINRRVDRTKFKWGDQWNPITGYHPTNPTTETFSQTNSTVLDIGAGIMYFDATPDKPTNLFGGFSVYHLNKPKDPIISVNNTELNTIPMRYSVHGGISFNVSPGLSVIPHALYMRQGSATETTAGLYAQLNVNDETNIMLGGYYRMNDAVAPFVGIDYKNFVVGLSYDVNTSTLGSMTRNVNSIEISVSYVKRNGSRSIIDFIRCSRL